MRDHAGPARCTAAGTARNDVLRGARWIPAALAAWILAAAPSWAVNITTYHVDNLRTGWNPNETVLTPANVAGSSFGVLATATFDGNVDAQPLIVQGLTIAGQGLHDVVFVATENNSIYALDAYTGASLLQANLGPAVPSALPIRHMPEGIQSTPVIDVAAGTIYVVTETLENGYPTYRIHALNLTTLADEMPSVVVAAKDKLDDDSKVKFRAGAQRQRPALLEANGNIYAAFGSQGDAQAPKARGYVFGWNAATLAPLARNFLTNHRSSPTQCGNRRTTTCLLSSIWMSGAGIAADSTGNLYAVTGNSEIGTYDGVVNIQQTAMKLAPDLSQMVDFFTPWNVDALDATDLDFGSGGITLLPDQALSLPHLAVAVGKTGTLYLLNRDSMGGHVSQAPDQVIGEYKSGACWCVSSYFTGSDGVGRVVTSGDRKIEIWDVVPTNKAVRLKQESVSVPIETGQDPGFFTTISSNGTTAGTAVIWAVGRPTADTGTLTLYAFDASSSATLVSMDAGTWPNILYNANIVPVVANGTVYVAGGANLTILGLGDRSRKGITFRGPNAAAMPPVIGHEVFGVIDSVAANRIRLRLRNGSFATVDARKAVQDGNAIPFAIGEAVGADGAYAAAGVFAASGVFKAKDSPTLWPRDQ
jgi:hypothetical protein